MKRILLGGMLLAAAAGSAAWAAGAGVAIADWDIEIDGMQAPDGSALPPLKDHVWVERGGRWLAAAVRPVTYPPPPGKP